MPEYCSWLFVENVPLLFDRERVARQLKVETWLDLAQLLREMNGSDNSIKSPAQPVSYVV
jgi:hypothetical protein